MKFNEQNSHQIHKTSSKLKYSAQKQGKQYCIYVKNQYILHIKCYLSFSSSTSTTSANYVHIEFILTITTNHVAIKMNNFNFVNSAPNYHTFRYIVTFGQITAIAPKEVEVFKSKKIIW